MVSISDDGRLATKVTADGEFLLVDLLTRKVIWRRNVKDHCVESIAIDSSGRYLAYPLDCRKVIVEEIVTGKQVEYESPAGNRGIHSIALGRGGYPLAFGACGRGIYVVRGPGNEPLAFHPLGPCEYLDFDAVHSLEFSRNARLLAAGWGYWSERHKTTAEQRKLPGWEDPGQGNSVGVTIWTVEDATLRAELPGSLEGSTAAFSPSDDLLVGLGDGNGADLALWNTRTGTRIMNLDEPGLSNPQFIRTGRLLVGLLPTVTQPNPRIYVLSTATGNVVATADTSSQDIMTRGHSAASASDKFLVAHRTGQVDVYQVSKDGHQIEKAWDF